MLFMGTFFICLFIFMMQFLWKYVDEMVGKGLEMNVLAQFFFYSALTLVPASLPLAILLAALITFCFMDTSNVHNLVCALGPITF